MNKFKTIFNKAFNLIKNYFFILQNTDIYQECEKALELNEIKEIEIDNINTEEYLNNYTLTTRWQTI